MNNPYNLTPKGTQLVHALRESGALIDIYSDEWLSGQTQDSPLSPKTIEKIHMEHGSWYRNHLLILFLSRAERSKIEQLLSLYPPLTQQIHAGIHKPCFLFINLATNQILCMGLGKDNRFFAIDAETNHDVDIYLEKNPSKENEKSAYLRKFTRLDYCDVVLAFANSLIELENEFVDDYNLASYDEVYELMNSEPNEEGLYFFEKDEEREVGSTKEQLDEILEKLDSVESLKEQALSEISRFFPECDMKELTG
jgi:hypothetical protein